MLFALNKQASMKLACSRSEQHVKIYESVDLLGFWFEIKAYEKNNPRHIIDIPRIIFFA